MHATSRAMGCRNLGRTQPGAGRPRAVRPERTCSARPSPAVFVFAFALAARAVFVFVFVFALAARAVFVFTSVFAFGRYGGKCR